jgi:hypothetical protein
VPIPDITKIELLRLQADHESTRSGVFIESPRAE